jgi:chemotaxis protein CheY-P-specific phosphatase CheC
MSMGPLLTMRRARQLEVVHRAVTLGLNAAAAQLSAFVGQPITIEAPRLGLCAIDDLVACALGSAFEEAPACDAEVVMTGIYLGMGGDVTGHVVLLLAPADARALVAPLIADLDPPADRREDLLLSALGEVGNITASGLLNALADAARLRIGPSCPAVVTVRRRSIVHRDDDLDERCRRPRCAGAHPATCRAGRPHSRSDGGGSEGRAAMIALTPTPHPPADTYLAVGIGQCVVSRDPAVALAAYGLGSCVAVAAWDVVARIAGVIHILLPEPPAGMAPGNPARFAVTGARSKPPARSARACVWWPPAARRC